MSKRKKKDDKRWEWNVDYSGIDKMRFPPQGADVKGEVLTEETVLDILRKPPSAPRSVYMSPKNYEALQKNLKGSAASIVAGEVDQLRKAVEKLMELVNLQQRTIEANNAEIAALKAEMADLKGLLSATLKMSRKGSGF